MRYLKLLPLLLLAPFLFILGAYEVNALAVDNGTFAFGYSAGTTGTLTYSSNYDTPNQSNSFLNPFPNKDFQRAVFQVKFGTITEEDPGYYFFRFWFPTACQNIEKYRGVSQYTSVYHDWLPANDAVLNGVNYCIVSYAYDFTALKTGDYARLYINTNNLRNFGTDGWYSGFVYEKISFNDYNSFMQDIRTENDDTNDKIIAEQEKTNEELGNIKDQITDLEGTINDNFNSCRPSKNLFNKNDVSNGTYLDADGNVQVNEYWVTSNYIPIESNSKYTYQGLRSIGLAPHWAYYDSNKQFISSFKPVVPAGTITTPSNAKYIRVVVNFGDTSLFQFEKGTYSSPYEEYGKEVCTNKIDEQLDVQKEQVETSKGIWKTIIELPQKLVDLLSDLLEFLFVPSEDFFEEFFNNLSNQFEEQLGFLSYPFTLIIDFLNRFIALEDTGKYIIHIPKVKVPLFENLPPIIEEQDFDLSIVLNQPIINKLWVLYLAFIDVFLILNFLNLCESKYNDFVGARSTPYEYYTVENSYEVNDETGEVTKHRLNERTTRRERVK